MPELSSPAPPTPLPTRRGAVIPVLAVALVLALVAALPYLAIGGLDAFINMDDDFYVYENPQVLEGLTVEGVRWAFTTFHIANWHPLTWLSHMTDVTVFGSGARGHHQVNILLHSLNTSLLFLALLGMTAALWRSALVAALFALHPLHVESVAWIAERKDVLSGLFFMLVLLAYERYVRRGGGWRYLLVVLLLALGLMAKPMLVTVPFLLLLLDLWPLGRTSWAAPAGGGEGRPVAPGRLIWEKVPLLVLALTSSGVTFLAQKAGGAMRSLETFEPGLRLANVALSYVTYIGKTLWPLSLSVYYPFPPEMPIMWKVVGASLVMAAVTAAALFLRRRPYFLVGWLWYVGMLVPVIGLVQVGDQAMADRYTYLPLTGLFVMAVWGAAELLRGRRRRWSAGVAAGTLLVLAPLTARQAGYWKDSITLFGHALSVEPGSHIIHNNLGYGLDRAGRTDEAIPHYREALRLRSDYYLARVNIGIALARTGRGREAVTHFREALRLKPDSAEAHSNFGVILMQMGRTDEAITHYREALRLQPDHAKARVNLGIALGRREKGGRQFRQREKLGEGQPPQKR